MHFRGVVVRLLTLLTIAICAVSVPCALGEGPRANFAANRITESIDESILVPLTGNTHPLAQPRFDLGPVAESTPTGSMILVLKRSAAQQQSLNDYLSALQNPSSPVYRHWLAPAQFGAAYGISDSDLETVKVWLEGHGFKIEKTSQARNTIQFSGTVGQLQRSFHTAIHSFDVAGERHIANVSDPLIPSALAPVVLGIAELNDFHPKSMAAKGVTGTYSALSKQIRPDFTLFSGTTPLLFTDPADAATIYDTPNSALNPNYSGSTYDGSGVNIGIVGDSNISLTDVTNYRLAFLGETSANANIPTVVIDGNDPGENGDEIEGLLDNEIAGGLAPKAKLYFYTSSDTDLQSGLFDAIFRAVDDNTVSILNISFGACESDLGTSGNAAVLEATEQAAAQGISVVVSSGDSGSAGCDASNAAAAQNGLAVNGLASTPYTIAVGGTDFDVLGTSFGTYVEDTTSGNPPYYDTILQYIPEEPWNDSTSVNTAIADNTPLLLEGSTNVIAGGGGPSAVYSKPAFQSGLTPTDTARDVPDVSFLAANGLYGAVWVVCADSGLEGVDCQTSNGQFVDGAHFSGYGGTSTAAPAFSGMLALVEQKIGSRLGQANYVLYQLANAKYSAVFHDVTVGDNSVYCAGGSANCNSNSFLSGFNASTGYDQASGLGSIDVANLVSSWNSMALTSTITSLSIDGSTAAVNVTHGASLTFKVNVAPAVATGVVAIADTANEVSGGVQNNGQIPINLTNGSGSVTYNGLPGGTYTVYARYSGDATDASSTSTPAINVTIGPETSTTGLTVTAYDPATGKPFAGGLSSVPYGAEMIFDAQVYGTAEGAANTQGLATGNITYADKGTTIGQAAISASNTASYPPLSAATFPMFSVGAHSVTASYPGDASYSASSSTSIPFTVMQAGSTVSGLASTASIPSAASTVITVTVSADSVGAAPTGKVILTANGSTLGTSSIAAGGGYPAWSQVKFTVQGSQLASGANTITMTYGGDTNYAGSTATIVINVTPSKFMLTNSGSISVTAGATSGNTASIIASPTNSFVGTVNLTCSVTTEPASATSPTTCTIPSSLSITGSSSVSSTVTAVTTAATTPGAYAIAVTGSDAATGTITSTTTVDVAVTAPAANPSFALSSSGSLNIAPGAALGNTAAVTITPSGGFTASVSLTCAVSTSIASPNDLPTCSIPSSVSVTGASAATATLTVNTTAATSAALARPLHLLGGASGGAALAIMVFFGMPCRRRRWACLASLFAFAALAAVVGCGGSVNSTPGNSGTTPGSYVVTVTGASAGVTSQTTAVNVTVN